MIQLLNLLISFGQVDSFKSLKSDLFYCLGHKDSNTQIEHETNYQ